VVEEGVGYELTGPIDEAELRKVRRDCDIRDAAILQRRWRTEWGFYLVRRAKSQ
jgi:hypothetical protein